MENQIKQSLYKLCLRLGDNSLILSHRLSEWCGHAPILEEDIALTNIALDLIGQSRMLLTYAAELEGKGRNEDDYAYLRDSKDFRNCLMVELPKGDFAYTITRQFLYSTYCYLIFQNLSKCNDETLAGIAAKSVKECKYHVRHSSEWLIRLGDGTKVSHDKVTYAVQSLWKYVDDLFDFEEEVMTLVKSNIIPSLDSLRTDWNEIVTKVLNQATIQIPDSKNSVNGSIQGLHSEHLGHILSDMQFLPRAYPATKW